MSLDLSKDTRRSTTKLARENQGTEWRAILIVDYKCYAIVVVRCNKIDRIGF